MVAGDWTKFSLILSLVVPVVPIRPALLSLLNLTVSKFLVSALGVLLVSSTVNVFGCSIVSASEHCEESGSIAASPILSPELMIWLSGDSYPLSEFGSRSVL